jgi:thiosulfate/3-mercaptopyruvate sulfurtransferase
LYEEKNLKTVRLFAVSIFFLSWLGTAQAAPVYVDTDWVAKRLNDVNVVLLDMSSDDTQYQRFHLPGASYFPNYYLMRQRKKDKVAVRLPQNELVYMLGQMGVMRQQHIILYDDMGGLNAGRMFFELESIGHPNVSVMDGGLVKWILEGRKVVNRNYQRPPTRYGEVDNPRIVEATMQEVDAAQKNRTVLIDARSQEEYLGDPKKHDGGHVPGAKWWEWSDSVAMDKGFVRKSDAELQQKLASLGATDKKQPVIAYCRTGHRAAQTYLTLRSLGYENVRLYANSMGEYGLYRKAKLTRGAKP